MTPLDLRIKYKFSTGLPPTTGWDVEGYKGWPNRDYGIWLEAKAWFLGNKARWYYKRNTGCDATFYDYKLKAINYNRGYKEWLEEIVCEGYTNDRVRL